MKITFSGHVVELNPDSQSAKIKRDIAGTPMRFFLCEKLFEKLNRLFSASKDTGVKPRGVFIVDGRGLVKFRKEKQGGAA